MVFEEPEPPGFPGEGPEDRFVFERKTQGAPQKRGRPKKVDQNQTEQALRLYFDERLSMRKVADILGISHMSVYRMISDPTIRVLI